MDTTFSRRLTQAFGLLGALTIIVAAIGVGAISRAISAKDHVLDVNERSVQKALQVQALTYRRSAAMRGFIITSDKSFLDRVTEVGTLADQSERDMIASATTAESRQLAERTRQLDDEWKVSLNAMVDMVHRGAPMTEIAKYMLSNSQPKRLQLENSVDDLAKVEIASSDRATEVATRQATFTRNIFLGAAAVVIAIALLLPFLLNKQLSGQIASAVQDIQSSSAELQSTATQQATGAREQATAMSEITTTMTELLTTSRQIASSAQRVAAFSSDTASAAQTSDRMMQRARSSVGDIRHQVDAVVNHMLELGRRSQQIGGVTEVINELAEQTNILAINANIEAVGAGESGRRFGVVAEEIRNLADRMSGAAREIRGMVEEVRSAVNSTVMATEAGSKAVDAGTRDFDAVTEALDQIVGTVQTTTEAAREIELSTKQQSTAVEQVNVAVSAVAQVSREMEASTTQASETATELARLSGRMAALVHRQRE